MAGLDPAIHQKRKALLQSRMDARVIFVEDGASRLSPAHDDPESDRYPDRASAPSIILTAFAMP
jgi:hypothetical protein